MSDSVTDGCVERIRIGWPHYDGIRFVSFTFRLHRLAVSSAPVTAFTHALRWATQHAHHGGVRGCAPSTRGPSAPLRAYRHATPQPHPHATHNALKCARHSVASLSLHLATHARAHLHRVPSKQLLCVRSRPDRGHKRWDGDIGGFARQMHPAQLTHSRLENVQTNRVAPRRVPAPARAHTISLPPTRPLHDPRFPQRARAASVVTPHHLRACPALLRPSLPTPRCRRHS